MGCDSMLSVRFYVLRSVAPAAHRIFPDLPFGGTSPQLSLTLLQMMKVFLRQTGILFVNPELCGMKASSLAKVVNHFNEYSVRTVAIIVLRFIVRVTSCQTDTEQRGQREVFLSTAHTVSAKFSI